MKILQGDALTRLREMDAESVQCCVTSPPYWGLRDYGTPSQVWGGDPVCAHEWGVPERPHHPGQVEQTKWKTATAAGAGGVATAGSFCQLCGAWLGNFGLEPTPELYVEHAVWIFREVRRVLRDDGSLWLNIGDSYNGYMANQRGTGLETERQQARKYIEPGAGLRDHGLKNKDLVGIPWMLAFALRTDGWYLRQEIIWAKPNPMPESVTDRCTKSHESMFLLSKSAKYYFDHEAIKEPCVQDERRPTFRGGSYVNNSTFDNAEGGKSTDTGNIRVGRSARDNFKRNGSKREQTIPGQSMGTHRPNREDSAYDLTTRNKRDVWTVATQPYKEAHFATFPPKLIEPCILAGCPVGGVVLDPFTGSGTTGVVALHHQRDFLGIELNPDYIALAHKRILAEILS